MTRTLRLALPEFPAAPDRRLARKAKVFLPSNDDSPEHAPDKKGVSSAYVKSLAHGA